MKRKILISAFIFIIIGTIWADDELQISYGMLRNSRFIEALVNNSGISYKLVVRQDRDGNLSMESPPFLVADFNGFLRMGELKDDRILSAMLVPYSDVDLSEGFEKGKNLKKLDKLSINPSLSGFALSFDNLDLISLNPVMNSQSPYGFAAILGNSNAFAGFMYACRNEISLRDKVSAFQVDWRRTGIGRNMVFWIIGGSDKSDFHGLEIESSAFVQSSWDRMLGGGTTTMWKLSAEGTKLGLNASRGLGGIGPGLKTMKETVNPAEELGIGAVLKDHKYQMEIRYVSSTYGKPIYGGRSQIRTIELKTALKYGKLKVEANHKTSFERDFAKVQTTEYKLSADAADAKIEMHVTLSRNAYQKSVFSNFFLEMEFEHGKAKMKDGKTQMELTLERKLDNCTLKIGFDQDRMVKASLSFKN